MLRSVLSQIAPSMKSYGATDIAVRNNPLIRRRVLAAIDQARRCGTDELAALSEALTMRSLRAARRTRYGRRRAESLSDWPVLSREQLRGRPGDFVNPLALPRIPASTGGTTGMPLKLWRSLECVVAEQTFIDRLLAPHGASLHGSRVAVLRADKVKDTSDPEPPYGRVSHHGARLTLSTPHLNARSIAWFCRALRDFAPTVLWVYPSAALSLLNLLEAAGERVQVPVVLASSEVLSATLHRALEQTLGCRVVNYYGQAERVCLAYSRRPEEFYFDPCYGRVQLSEIESDDDPSVRRFSVIATSQWNSAMPLVRYETGDSLAVPRDYTESDLADVTLGRKPFLRLEGREGEYLLGEDGVRIIGLNQVPRELNNVLQLQFIQQTPRAVTINVIATPSFSSQDAEQIMRQARAKIPSTIGLAIKIVDSPVLNAKGKAPFVMRMMD